MLNVVARFKPMQGRVYAESTSFDNESAASQYAEKVASRADFESLQIIDADSGEVVMERDEKGKLQPAVNLDTTKVVKEDDDDGLRPNKPNMPLAGGPAHPKTDPPVESPVDSKKK